MRPGCIAIGFASVSLIGNRYLGPDVGAEVEQKREVRRVAFLSTGQVEGDRIAVEVGLQMDFGRKAAA